KSGQVLRAFQLRQRRLLHRLDLFQQGHELMRSENRRWRSADNAKRAAAAKFQNQEAVTRKKFEIRKSQADSTPIPRVAGLKLCPVRDSGFGSPWIFGFRPSDFKATCVQAFAAFALSAVCATLTNSLNAAPSVAAMSANTLRSSATLA